MGNPQSDGVQCTFYANTSREVFTHTNPSGHVCVRSVSGTELLGQRAARVRTVVSINCDYTEREKGERHQSQLSKSVTVVVWDTVMLGKPHVDITQTQGYIGENVYIRCKADSASQCLFYRDQALIRTVSYNRDHKFCYLSVSVDELVGDREFTDTTVLSVSCGVELTLDGELNIIHHSDTKAISVIDRLGPLLRPRIEVDPNIINREGPVQMTCISGNGTQCVFYRGYRRVTRSPYREELGGCRVSVLGRDLLGERDGEGGTEVQLRCALEVKLGEEALTSRLSADGGAAGPLPLIRNVCGGLFLLLMVAAVATVS
ncbi:hypothetical protein AAFF_G00251960 [Aldrovandia affinis]|uniref:Uncharacterized protein n=1 Tax=Aldrovandia affinis TaxID=143900 RepID=A0AAD7SVG4_9TELE|nr:hypothetical protein AAFF_G00251960 [Aldrovandia affinis]